VLVPRRSGDRVAVFRGGELVRRDAARCGAAALVLGLQVLAAIVAVAANYPSRFDFDGRDAGDEWIARGTALSPPLLPMVLFVLATAMAFRRDRWGTAGAIGICLLALLFIVGSLGEAFGSPTEDVSRGVLMTSGVLGTVSALVLLWLGFNELRSRRRNGWRASGAAAAG